MNKERLINEFIELVKVDSETKFEAKINTLLQEKFTALGLEVKEDEATKHIDHEANNLICTLPGNVEHVDPIFFTCHMDTVTPGQQIQPQINDDYITSDGTTILGADDKAGIAVLLEVIRQIKEQDLAHGTIQFVITVGEESGLMGAKVIDQSLLQATYGYALDSDGAVGSLVTTAPYQAKINATVTGTAAHAGVAPEKGISAISVAAKAIAKTKLGRIDEETTANIGYFKGGKSTETNVVVDQVDIVAEARSLKEEKLEALLDHMRETFNEATNQYGGSAELNIDIAYPGFSHEPSSQVVKVAQLAAEKANLPSELIESGGGSDANIFNGYGIPTANLCVGYENIHTTKERIHTDHLVNLSHFILEIVKLSANKD
ncbi:MAG TPA: M20/M25/M40 family metallo-hydrolase [Pseudogracilibacillus sp.]|nr:M20/M25/M40 family metallo-hydrolase [Pseudogracilibacillus sp.]